MTCTFFGHRHTPSRIREHLLVILKEIIEKYHVDNFYVGNHGDFDSMVCSVLAELQKEYPQISYAVVLAYLPQKKGVYEEKVPTVYPEGLEFVPKRFAILKRNEWMVKHSEFIVSYVIGNTGGAAQFVQYAKKKNKIVINLAEISNIL